MVELALPALYAVFIWWFATGAVIYLDGLPRSTFKWSLIAATAMFALANAGLFALRDLATPLGAVLGFTCALVIWGWHELAFYTGIITGPRRTGCVKGCHGWKHFGHAVAAIAYHELLIALSVVSIALMTWASPNKTGLWTLLILWAMQLSAKLNVFLGARNLSAHLLPDHLSYLRSFMRERRANAFLPIALLVGAAGAGWLALQALASLPGSFTRTDFAILATLTGLGVLEHLFLLLPIPTAKLWTWSLSSRRKSQTLVAPLASPAAPMTQATWSRQLPAPCDRESLDRLLERVAGGAFGKILRLEGVARSGDTWIRFDVAGGRTNIASFCPNADVQAQFTAIGRNDDLEELSEAFQACAEKAVA